MASVFKIAKFDGRRFKVGDKTKSMTNPKTKKDSTNDQGVDGESDILLKRQEKTQTTGPKTRKDTEQPDKTVNAKELMDRLGKEKEKSGNIGIQQVRDIVDDMDNER